MQSGLVQPNTLWGNVAPTHYPQRVSNKPVRCAMDAHSKETCRYSHHPRAFLLLGGPSLKYEGHRHQPGGCCSSGSQLQPEYPRSRQSCPAPDMMPLLPRRGRNGLHFQCEQEIRSWRAIPDPGGCGLERSANCPQGGRAPPSVPPPHPNPGRGFWENHRAAQSSVVRLLKQQVCFPTFRARVSEGKERETGEQRGAGEAAPGWRCGTHPSPGAKCRAWESRESSH